MRKTLIFIMFFVVRSLFGQQLSVGAYLTAGYGNITYKADIHSFGNYDPGFASGGGLDLNYYKNRWLLNTGINFKHAVGVWKIPIVSDDGETWTGEYDNVINILPVLTIPVGVHYAIIYQNKFKLYGGVRIENGYLVKSELIMKNNHNNYKYWIDLKGKYYLGIMPELRLECNLTERKFLFSNVGVCYQLNHFERTWWPNDTPTIYRINNVFIDIGFGYRFKN